MADTEPSHRLSLPEGNGGGAAELIADEGIPRSGRPECARRTDPAVALDPAIGRWARLDRGYERSRPAAPGPATHRTRGAWPRLRRGALTALTSFAWTLPALYQGLSAPKSGPSGAFCTESPIPTSWTYARHALRPGYGCGELHH